MPLLGAIANERRFKLVRSNISKEMSILDVGCGTGWLVEALRNEGFDAKGIDPNLPIEDSKTHLLRRSAYETHFADNTFDCIICLETIEHLEPRAYGEIKRIAKDSSKLIVTTPKKRWNGLIEFLTAARLTDPLVTPHINLVSPSDIPFLQEEIGSFMVLEWYGIYKIQKQ
jgi:2-polyprenyl-3-methyl-5-hydroxy-6-metoxy-1,4-benzoquinol methylase